MSKPRKLVRLSELQPGQHADFYVQLAEKNRLTTRDGKQFYNCRFRDRSRTVSVAVWSDGEFHEECQSRWQVGEFYKIRGSFSIHDRYGPQIEIEQIRPVEDRDHAEGFSELDFLERSRLVPDESFAELEKLVQAEIRDEPLRSLVSKLLHDNVEELKLLPASERRYYPFAGGWLEHTLNVARSSACLADQYSVNFPDMRPPLNRDLVVAGAVLHDIKELETGLPGLPAKAGVSGELLGHLYLGYDLIRATAKDIPDLNPELLELLLHIVTHHLKLPEWGSPRLPCIPEVLIVHHADDLDAKFEMYSRCLTRDVSDGPFTERDPMLGRPLLKGRTV
jgi:3'-5' exoribonuclease